MLLGAAVSPPSFQTIGSLGLGGFPDSSKGSFKDFVFNSGSYKGYKL